MEKNEKKIEILFKFIEVSPKPETYIQQSNKYVYQNPFLPLLQVRRNVRGGLHVALRERQAW